MYLRVRHLNLGTLRPVGGRMVCHALLVEAGERLVLVDTGFGTEDLARLEHVWSGIARRRRSEPYDALRRQLTRNAYTAIVTRPAMDPAQTAIAQVEALGHSAADVTDIVLTHMDLDHAGGLADFPSARVHVDAVEHHHAMAAATARGRSIHRFRYWPYQWAHQPAVTTYARGGDGWHGI